MLRKALTEKSTDHSDTGHFSFSFFCDNCGKEWVSPVQPFSEGECTNVEHDEALKLLWASEHRAVFDEANLEACLKFNLCPVCGRRVCDDCFCFGQVTQDGVCVNCREK
jgi:hypothetical protein